MLGIEEALDRILGNVAILEPEEKPILDCLGQVLAEDVCSAVNVPPLDNSAMDGYAVQWASIQGATPASPCILRVIAEVAAGSLPDAEVKPGTAVRIMTGAPVPAGCDTVVPFENTDETEGRQSSTPRRPLRIGILRQVDRGANIRPAAEDVSQGQMVLKRGTVLRPPDIGVLASVGRPQVRVTRRPIVGVLATGDELVELDRALPSGKIYNSNAYGLSAQVISAGGIPRLLGIAGDNWESVVAKIREGLGSDMLVTSGGVSAGDYDVVKDVIAQLGQISFWQVRMKPGKPLAFGLLNGDGRRVPHIGLPGNPVSAMVAFEQFGRPAILKMLGKRDLRRPTVKAVLQGEIRNRDGRRTFARAVVTRDDGKYVAQLTRSQGSACVTSMARANGLVVVPEDVAALTQGDEVEVQMLDWQ